MKRLFASFCFICLLHAGPVAGADGKIPEIPRISAAETQKKFKEGTALLVDSMNARTYAKYHVFGAISLPGDGESDLNKIRAADLQIPFDQEMIVYCD